MNKPTSTPLPQSTTSLSQTLLGHAANLPIFFQQTADTVRNFSTKMMAIWPDGKPAGGWISMPGQEQAWQRAFHFEY